MNSFGINTQGLNSRLPISKLIFMAQEESCHDTFPLNRFLHHLLLFLSWACE